MNFGLIIRNSLNKSELPVNSSEHLDLAKSYCNNNIQQVWYEVAADFRTSRDKITTVANSDEYLLNKLFDGFVRNTLRGPSTRPRILKYKDPSQFFRINNNHEDNTGKPGMFTFGDMAGYDKQILTGTTPRVESSLANKTQNNVNVVPGSFFVTSDSENFSLNDVGLRFQKDGDAQTYKISKFVNSKKIKLSSKYRGVKANNANYRIGDVGIHVNVQGFVGGEIESEDAILDGSNPVFLTKTFTIFTSISKSDLTGGRIIVRDNGATVTIGTIAPGELEIERQTVLLSPIPDSVEELQYRFYMKHPILRLDSDRLLIPQKYHRVIEDMTTMDLLEWAGRPVPAKVSASIIEGRKQIVDDANDSSLENNIPNDVGQGSVIGLFDNDIDQDFVGHV